MKRAFLFARLLAMFAGAILPLSALSQTNVTLNGSWSDFSGPVSNLTRVVITPLGLLPQNFGAPLLKRPIQMSVANTPSLTNGFFTTNLMAGAVYQIEVSDGYASYAQTNSFATNLAGTTVTTATGQGVVLGYLPNGTMTFSYQNLTVTGGSGGGNSPTNVAGQTLIATMFGPTNIFDLGTNKQILALGGAGINTNGNLIGNSTNATGISGGALVTTTNIAASLVGSLSNNLAPGNGITNIVSAGTNFFTVNSNAVQNFINPANNMLGTFSGNGVGLTNAAGWQIATNQVISSIVQNTNSIILSGETRYSWNGTYTSAGGYTWTNIGLSLPQTISITYDASVGAFCIYTNAVAFENAYNASGTCCGYVDFGLTLGSSQALLLPTVTDWADGSGAASPIVLKFGTITNFVPQEITASQAPAYGNGSGLTGVPNVITELSDSNALSFANSYGMFDADDRRGLAGYVQELKLSGAFTNLVDSYFFKTNYGATINGAFSLFGNSSVFCSNATYTDLGLMMSSNTVVEFTGLAPQTNFTLIATLRIPVANYYSSMSGGLAAGLFSGTNNGVYLSQGNLVYPYSISNNVAAAYGTPANLGYVLPWRGDVYSGEYLRENFVLTVSNGYIREWVNGYPCTSGGAGSNMPIVGLTNLIIGAQPLVGGKWGNFATGEVEHVSIFNTANFTAQQLTSASEKATRWLEKDSENIIVIGDSTALTTAGSSYAQGLGNLGFYPSPGSGWPSLISHSGRWNKNPNIYVLSKSGTTSQGWDQETAPVLAWHTNELITHGLGGRVTHVTLFVALGHNDRIQQYTTAQSENALSNMWNYAKSKKAEVFAFTTQYAGTNAGANGALWWTLNDETNRGIVNQWTRSNSVTLMFDHLIDREMIFDVADTVTNSTGLTNGITWDGLHPTPKGDIRQAQQILAIGSGGAASAQAIYADTGTIRNSSTEDGIVGNGAGLTNIPATALTGNVTTNQFISAVTAAATVGNASTNFTQQAVATVISNTVYPLGGSGPFTRTVLAAAGDNARVVVSQSSGETFYDSAGALQLSVNPSGVTAATGFVGNGSGLTSINASSISIGTGTSAFVNGTNANGAELVITNSNTGSWAGFTAQSDTGNFGSNYVFVGINNSKYTPAVGATGTTNTPIIEFNSANPPYIDVIGNGGNNPINIGYRASTNSTVTTNIVLASTGITLTGSGAYTGSGSGLTSIPAAQISGIIPTNNLAQQGYGITNVQYANLSGTIPSTGFPVITNGACIPTFGDYDFTAPGVTGFSGFTSNTVYLRKVFVPTPVYVSNVVVRVGTGNVSYFGSSLYDINGNKIIDCSPLVLTPAGDNYTNIVTRAIVGPGYYYMGWSVNITNSATMRMLPIGTVSFINQGQPIFGTAANVAANGVNPSTTGTITSNTPANWPLFMFKN